MNGSLAVGAGVSHFSELSKEVYTDAKTKIYVDSSSQADIELRGLYAPIEAQIGDIINGQKAIPSDGITIFHSMGVCLYILAKFNFDIISLWVKWCVPGIEH